MLIKSYLIEYNVLMKNIKTKTSLVHHPNVPFMALLFTGLYVASNIFADILSVKMLALGSISSFDIEVDAGTIIYPLAFVVRDMLHKVVGRRLAGQVVLMTACFNILMVILFNLVSVLPGAIWWVELGHQEAYDTIILAASRIALASIVAETLSNLTSTYVFSKIIRVNPLKTDIKASLVSNFLATIIDSTLFGFLAFYGVPDFPLVAIISLIIVNIMVKGLVAVVGSPLVRLIKIRVDHAYL
jgi:uncharacterized integral membrane protein (TIGR00697 family)